MSDTRRSGLPALAPPVSSFGPSARSGAAGVVDEAETPPALPPKEPRRDKLTAPQPKPKAIFPGPPQSFAMSGPRRLSEPQNGVITNGQEPRSLRDTPNAAESARGAAAAALAPLDTGVNSRKVQSRSQTLPLAVAGSHSINTARGDARTNGSPGAVSGPSGEKMSVRTSSRPRAPRSSTGGPGHLSSTPNSLRSIDTSARAPPSPVLPPSPTFRPAYAPTSVTASPTDSLHPHTYLSNDGHASPNSYQRHPRARERSASPSPTSRDGPSRTSVMDRPRPKTPEPLSPSTFASQDGGPTRLLAPRPSAPAVLPAFAAAPIFPGPRSSSASKTTSVLDRPRPKTPEVLARFESSPSSSVTVSPIGLASRQSDGRTTTPTPIFPSKPRPSVMDRPRSKTPQPALILDTVSREDEDAHEPVANGVVRPETRSREPSPALDVLSPVTDRESASAPAAQANDHGAVGGPKAFTPRPSVLDRPRPKTPDAASWLHGADRSGTSTVGQHSRSNYSSATSTTAFSSSKSGSLDSIGPLSGGSAASVATPASTVSSFRPSLDASSRQVSKETPESVGSPLLKLDFDFDSSFSSAETMFGLSDFLKPGDATPTQRTSAPAASAPAASEVPVIAAIAPVQSHKAEGGSEPVERPEPVTAQPKQRSSSLATPVLAATSPRPSESLVNAPPASPRRSTSPAHRAVADIRDQTACDDLSSHSRQSSNAGAAVSASEASPDQPKRKRRKSLASLLSFRSTSQSIDDSHAPSGSAAGAAYQRSQQQAEVDGSERGSGHRSSLSGSFGDHSAPNVSGSNSSQGVEPALNRVESHDLARQFSYNVDSSPEGSRKRGRGTAFQLISATSSRRPSRNASGSISSLHTTETDSSDFHRPSLDYGRVPSSRGASDSYPERPDSRHQRAPSGTLPLGRRLVEKFSRNAATRPSPVATAQSWTAPLKDHSAEDSTPRPRLGRRRGSFSSLLGFGNDSQQPVKSEAAPKKLLGMSLAAGRRSEDLLTSGRTTGSAQRAQNMQTPDSRRSFDVLAERTPRKSGSSDDLLIVSPSKPVQLATAPLPEAIPAQFATAPLSRPSADHAVDLPDVPVSPTQTITATDDSHEAQQSEPVIATATRISILGSLTTQPNSEVALLDAPTSPDIAQPAPTSERAESAVTATPTKVAPRRLPSPPPVVPIWRQQRSHLKSPQGVAQTSMSSAWMALEEAIDTYQHLLREGRADRGAIISTVVLPFLRNEEQQGRTHLSKRLAKRQRDVLFGWVELMTSELKRTQPVHRGALLEAVATILEGHNLSIASLGDDEADQRRFRSAVVHILDFAIEKLNDKAVYANTLVFSGRILALAFFRIDGVALKLIRALPPVKRLTLRRILQEAGADENALPAVDRECYPSHLLPLCLTSFRDYAAQVLTPRSGQSSDTQVLVHDGDIHIEMSGNWLIRWTASDSDLPFSFYRAYFRQLSSLLVPFELRGATAGEPYLPAAHVITAPGFLFVAASLLDKSDALVHRNLRSVTSIGHSSGSFNTNDSANLAFGQKPKVLELAQRRVTTTMLDVVGGPRAGNLEAVETAPDAAARRYLFGTMLQVWIRATVKRTSMWDQRGVFLLLDLIEGLIYTLAYPVAPMSDSVEDDDSAARPDERSLDLLDIAFIFDFVRRILSEADNTVTLMRTIAFVYAHFEILTLRPHDRTELCERLILDDSLFQRLFLHWNSGCRGFFIRLLVWRVSRLGAIAREVNVPHPPDQSIVSIFNLLNVRLEAVRKRHEQLEPADNLSTDDSFFRPKRSTICSTRGVKEAPWALDETGEDAGAIADAKMAPISSSTPTLDVKPSKTERLDDGNMSAEVGKTDQTAVSKVVSWLKGGRSKKSGRANRPKPIAVPKSGSAQEWPTASLPTKVETGNVLIQREQPALSRSGSGGASATPGLTRQGSSASTTSNSEKRRSRNSAFFAFEFENGVVSRAEVDPNLLSPGEPAGPTSPPGSSSDAASPTRPRSADRVSALSPRVSVRFSKRSSILPPAALDLLKATGIEEVPPIPERFRQSVQTGYDKRLHPYAVRGLRDYEDALDEWTDWVARLQEEEEQAPSAFDIVPRLAVNWPLNSEEN
ncbi:hypothetical protein JCM10908_000461 [Rhodotorula pacifica]|uniref:uncharacterized protein n=1 Tax=Rhodotorula pacifica TaxID=1495444 RepID=UPI003178BFE6